MNKINIKSTVQNLIKNPLTVCFTIFVMVIFLLYLVFPEKELSEWENRYLARRPELRLSDIADGSFMNKYEDYINDQIPFRDGFIKLKAFTETVLLKVENNGIARGGDSYLFTKNTGDTSQFDKNIDIITKFAQNVDNDVTVAIAPNACDVLKDKLPRGFLTVDQNEKLSAIRGNESLLNSARVVDLECALSAHGDEYIYYRTDHHWTTLGAYYAYCEISDNPVSINDIKSNQKEGFLGTLYAKYKGLSVTPDTVTYYEIPVKSYRTDDTERSSLYDVSKLDVFDKYGMFMWGNFGKCEIKTETENGKKLIVFKDSYANSLIPFLTFDYEDITVIDLRYYSDSVGEFVSMNPDAHIMFINNFDFLNEDNHFYKLMK